MKLTMLLASTARGGGTRVFFEFANQLSGQGHEVKVLSFGREPDWYPLRVPFQQVDDFPAYGRAPDEIVMVSHLYQIPLVWRAAPRTRLIWYCQGYDAFASATTLEESRRDSPELLAVLELPFPALSISRSVQGLLRERGKDSTVISYGLDRERFYPRERLPLNPTPRVLMVLDPDIPWKGFPDGLEALKRLSGPKTLVLLTRNLRWTPPSLDFPMEIHRCPSLSEIVEVMASCHVLCCASWYDGLPLPPLEAMAMGLPVVCTRSLGIDDYGRDGENLLLADIGCPDQLARQLERVLHDQELAARLMRGGLATAEHGFDWEENTRALARACEQASYAACPEQEDLSLLMERLERSGHYTPVALVREAARNYDELSRLATLAPGPERTRRLQEMRERLRPHKSHRAVFKAHFDACQLLLAFPDRSLDLNLYRGRICP